jgi:hypothetical protein
MRSRVAPFARGGALRPVGLERGGTPLMPRGRFLVPACVALELALCARLRLIGVPGEDSSALPDC